MMEFNWYSVMQFAPIRPGPFGIVTAHFERFTEEDISEFERVGVKREEIEKLNSLMDEMEGKSAVSQSARKGSERC